MRYLLRMLGLRAMSHTRKLTLIAAVRRIEEAKLKATKILKSDKFLADSHWEVVAGRTLLRFPVEGDEDEEAQVRESSG